MDAQLQEGWRPHHTQPCAPVSTWPSCLSQARGGCCDMGRTELHTGLGFCFVLSPRTQPCVFPCTHKQSSCVSLFSGPVATCRSTGQLLSTVLLPRSLPHAHMFLRAIVWFHPWRKNTIQVKGPSRLFLITWPGRVFQLCKR